jgi:hypothetical protein
LICCMCESVRSDVLGDRSQVFIAEEMALV